MGEEVEQGLAEEVEENAISGTVNLIENKVENDDDDEDNDPTHVLLISVMQR